MWGVILGILTLWLTIRGWRMGGPAQRVGGMIDGVCNNVQAGKRRLLLVDAPLRSWFGRLPRLQIALLGCLSGYLLVLSLVSIVYKTWVTPVKGYTDVYNTRTGIGGFADRVGALAYALTPLTVLLAQRESILSLVTGIPYQHFSFLHKWLGRIIFAQSFLHTLGWTLVETWLYQPQPKVYTDFLKQQYAVWGCIAMLFITFLTVFSTQWAIKRTGYEFFKWTHWIIAILYIAACWGHWAKLACWMIPSLALIFIDQGVRMLRLLALHTGVVKGGSLGFRPANAEVRMIGEGDDIVTRIDFQFEHMEAWQPGQHFFLCFPALSIWSSHPFTTASLPDPQSNVQHHTYLLRVRKGQTSQLAAVAQSKGTIDTIMTGPYGFGFPRYDTQNVLLVAGRTGVTFTHPIAFAAIRQLIIPQAIVDFVWVIRRAQDLLWLPNEMAELKAMLADDVSLRIKIFVTRESTAHLAPCCDVKPVSGKAKVIESEKLSSQSSSSTVSELTSGAILQALLAIDQPRFSVDFMPDEHPSMQAVVEDFTERAATRGGDVQILGSGPESMGSDLRAAVAVIRTSEEVHFYWDSRE
ncbi:hypothetical protein B0A48_14800 [Cryoendolithus antarcticus]|uniref:ferric-chelate reductase (NADPH) n=1 Tax=Cryoendolithus antarcticus TaxID=1507870 RepID=A0A1V8SKK6_9PEZI|nr:hypothetical protein B0A48_14800 [Cryoendolithus antarcticus]